MENFEMPTVMTANTPTTIGGGGFDSSFAPSIAETRDERVTPQEVASQTSDDMPKGFAEILQSKSTADKLLDSAKKDGFEDALQRLIDDQFEPDEQVVEDQPEVEVPPKSNIEELVDASEERNIVDGETVEPQQEEIPIHEKIVMLEEKVDTLQKENKELLERVKIAERTNSVNQEMMLLLTKALYEIAKEEENEEKKIGLLELIVKMLTLFMQEIMTDGSAEKQELQSEKTAPKGKKSSKKSDILRALVRDMENNSGKAIDMNSQRTQNPASIEMPAA